MCGRIKGYQFGENYAFYRFHQGIDGQYVDGVSLTHGKSGSREHIWTFAAGLTESHNMYYHFRCPCDTSSNDRVPSFVGNHYFCESGQNSAFVSGRYILFPDDPVQYRHQHML